MASPKQKFLDNLIRRLSVHNSKAMLGRPGYSLIIPKTSAMNNLVEGVAKQDPDTWKYYLNMPDGAYDRLVKEAYRNS